MNDGIVTLIAEIDESTEEEIEVFATIESIAQKEFFSAAQTGFKPELKITMWENEYEEQSIIKIGGKRYSIYRTYVRSDQKIELYLTSKAGVI